jgi:hypothetical protein
VLAALALAVPINARDVATSPIAASCSVQEVAVVMEPPGRISLAEYHFGTDGVAHPTGRILASLDVATRTINYAVCQPAKTWRARPSYRGFAGPWPRTVESKMFCTSGSTGVIRFQIAPIRNSKRAVLGYRVLVKRDGVVGVDGRLTRHGGGISYDPERCDRNLWP